MKMQFSTTVLLAFQGVVRCVASLALLAVTQLISAETTGPRALSRSEAFFGVHFDLHPAAEDKILGRDATAKNIGEFLERVKPDFVQYDCKGHAGYTGYPTEVGYASPGIVKDALRLWRGETSRRGVGLYVHYSGVWDSAAVKHHPHWARIDEQDNPDPHITSVFGDYVDNLMIPQLKEVVSEYDLDGLWVDGECWAAKLDYGTTAVQEWKEKTGRESVPTSPSDDAWQEWKGFHRDAFERYLMHWVDELHRHDPELQITSNWAYTPHMPVPVKADLDFLSGDFSAKESVDRARFEARYLDSTGMPWDLMAWGFNSHSGGTGGPHQAKTAEQLMQEAAVVMGLGGGMQVYFQPTRGGYVSPVITDTAGKVADFCRKRQKLSHKSKSVPQVALLLSSKSFLHRSDAVFSPHGQYNALEGALHALLENGFSVDLLAEHQLEPRINDYPVLVIAQAPVLDDSFRDAVVAYVQRGGALVLLDQDSTRPFAGYLELDQREATELSNAYIGDETGKAPVPGEWLPVQVAGDAEVVGYRTDQQGFFTKTNDGITTGLTNWTKIEPAATVTNVLSGSVVAVHGPVSEAFFNAHHPVLRRWIGDLIELSFSDPEARVINNPRIDMSLRKTPEGQSMVHLVNTTGAQRADRFGAIDQIPSSGPVKVQWRLEKKPERIVQYPEEKELKFKVGSSEGKNRSRPVEIEVDDVAFHSVLVAEFKEGE